jgi:hypothetical protein
MLKISSIQCFTLLGSITLIWTTAIAPAVALSVSRSFTAKINGVDYNGQFSYDETLASDEFGDGLLYAPLSSISINHPIGSNPETKLGYASFIPNPTPVDLNSNCFEAPTTLDRCLDQFSIFLTKGSDSLSISNGNVQFNDLEFTNAVIYRAATGSITDPSTGGTGGVDTIPTPASLPGLIVFATSAWRRLQRRVTLENV